MALAVDGGGRGRRTEDPGGRHSAGTPWPSMPGSGAEDYLVGVAALAEGGERVTGARLAKLLGVSEPSVTQMVHRLAAFGLAVRRPRQDAAAWPGIRLTTAGAAAAAWLLTRRRVCECFFVDGIGLDWPTAQQAADQMEHGLSFEAVQQLHQGLGVPTTCPHGNRLDLSTYQPSGPGSASDAHAGSERATHPDLALADASAGARVVVERLLGPIEQDVAALRHFQEEGIAPGQTLLVEGSVPQAGALTVRRGRRRCVLPARLAAFVGVRVQRANRTASASASGEDLPPPCRPDGNVRLTAVRVEGPCESGHTVGDCFVLGHRTPAGLCGASYAAMLPVVKRMLASPDGAALPEAFERRCPGDGYVVWRLEPVPGR